MRSEWPLAPLAALVEYLNRGSAPSYVETGGMAVLNQKCIRDWRVDFGTARRTDHIRRPVAAERRLQPGDILVNSTGVGTLGRVAQVWELPEPSTVDSHVTIVRPCGVDVDARFLGYAMKLRQDAIEALGHGSTGQTELGRTQLGELALPVPPRHEQEGIGAVLAALDDKIELNRRMNETLEEIARAVFKEWFHHLLQKPRSDLPDGWTAGALGEYFTVGLGGAWGEDAQTPKASEAVHCLRGIDCHNLAALNVPEVPTRWLSPRQIASRSLEDGTILVEGSGSFCGRSLLWRDQYLAFFHLPVTYSNFVKRLSPNCTSAQAAVCWYFMREAYDTGYVQAYRTGTAFPNLDVPGLLAGLHVVVPSAGAAAEFAELTAVTRSVNLRLEIQTLAEIRDTLLPKLICGELRIPNAERLVSEVT